MRVLEVNVDDVGLGGVYSLVRRVIRKKPEDMTIDIACIAHFEDAKHVKALAKYGTKVHYIGTDGPKITRAFRYKKNLTKLLEEENYDVVHIHGDTAYLLRIFASAAKKAGVPKIILHSHAAGVDGNMRFLKSLLHKMCRHSLVLYGTDFVSCSDVASEWMFPNIDKEDIIKIHNGVSTAAFHFDEAVRNRVREDLGIPDGTMLVGHVGRFNYQKNHVFLLDILAELMIKKPDTKLLLVGKGPKEREIKQDAAAYGLSRNIIFYGTSNKVNELMQAMDAFVLPSHFEGLPVVGVEAQAAGLPTFFSDQITEEAKIIDTVEFLPVTKDAEQVWAERVLKRRVTLRKRAQGAAKVKRSGFGIARTVKEFLALYTLEEDLYDDELPEEKPVRKPKRTRSEVLEEEFETTDQESGMTEKKSTAAEKKSAATERKSAATEKKSAATEKKSAATETKSGTTKRKSELTEEDEIQDDEFEKPVKKSRKPAKKFWMTEDDDTDYVDEEDEDYSPAKKKKGGFSFGKALLEKLRVRDDDDLFVDDEEEYNENEDLPDTGTAKYTSAGTTAHTAAATRPSAGTRTDAAARPSAGTRSDAATRPAAETSKKASADNAENDRPVLQDYGSKISFLQSLVKDENTEEETNDEP